MTKRKADIFTVVESMPNWFADRQEDKALPEGSKGTLPTVLGPVPRHGPQSSRLDPLLLRLLPIGRGLALTRGCWLKGLSVRPDGTRPTGLGPTWPNPSAATVAVANRSKAEVKMRRPC